MVLTRLQWSPESPARWCDTDARDGLPLAGSLAVLVIGAILGTAAVTMERDIFAVGLVILTSSAAAILFLSRIAGLESGRLAAGDLDYKAFFEHAVEGVFRTTPDGHYLDVNPALAEIYGYASPEALKRGLTDIASQLYVDPRRRDEFAALMQKHDKVGDFVSEIRRKDGTSIWISENARAVRDWSGRLVCYEGMVENVTAKFEAARAARDGLQRAEEANRAKSAFLAAMSHELKTPLNAIIGFSEIIKDEVLGALGNKVYLGYAGDIHASGHRLLAIINDILDVSRLEGGAITLHSQDCTPDSIVRTAIGLARQVTRDARPIAVELPELPAITADAARLSQALANLLSNALKFTPEGGSVALSARRDAAGGMNFIVSDTGIGMAPEKVAAALEPFRQLDGSLARRFEGAGLGLSIARALIELHGGSLSITSAPGAGTTVTIRLPAVRTRPASRAVA